MTTQKTLLKFVLFIPQLGVGGAERVFVEYANGLVGRGVEVHLACLKGGTYEKELAPAVQVHQLGGRMRKAPLLLFRLLRTVRPDILLSGLTGPNLIAAMVGRAAKVPSIWISIHNDLSSSESVKNPIFRSCEYLSIWFAATLAARVFAVSQGVGGFLIDKLKVSRGKVSVVHNPIYHDGIVKLAEEAIPDPIARIVKGKRYLVSAGRLEQQKGFDLLIEAYALAGLMAKGIGLIILGEGSARSDLVKLAQQYKVSSSVYFPGFIPNPYAVFYRAEAFVLSSRWEGFGNVLVEALACGVPIISFDCPSGPREILEGVNGCLLVPPQDVQGLAQALASHFSEPQVENGHGRELKRARAEQFSRERAVDKLLSSSGLGRIE